MTGAVLLAAEIAPLRELGAWEPVALRLDALASALRGGEGVTPDDVLVLRTWARRWSRLAPVLRGWYAETAPTSARASAALYWLLTQEPRPRPDYLRWGVGEVWRETRGCLPYLDLLPALP